MDNSDYMSGYEARIYKGYKKSAADMLRDDRMLQNTVKKCLGVEVEKILDDGSTANIPVAVELVALKLSYWKDHPEKIDLKELSTVLGENKVEGQITLRGASELFGDIAIKDETK